MEPRRSGGAESDWEPERKVVEPRRNGRRGINYVADSGKDEVVESIPMGAKYVMKTERME